MKPIADVQNECDVNDVFDDIVMVENRFTEKGHNEGYTEATARTDEIHRGFTLGVDMSAAIAAEAGNHWAFATVWLARLKKKSHRRKIKVLEELKERGDQIIDCGTEHEEWDQRLEDARAKFKQAKSLVGSTPCITTSQEGMSF